ncbi:MAG TPA: chromosome partitioning protein ParB [Marinobacter hydrocarbonoclasticus]|nr:chromosome partitioning protein ParB [Marinobacter nauticus]
MAAKKRGLGERGLGALLQGSKVNLNQETSDHDGELREIPVDLIQRGRYQPRRDMDPAALQELADSIRQQGVMQPVVVRPVSEGRYELIAGERRWRATQLAELDRIPAIIRDVPDEAAIAMALIENIQRENLNPVEEANGLRRLLDEFGLTHQQVADSIGRSRAAVSNLLRLLNLDPAVRVHLENGRLEAGHARAILSLPREQQLAAADTVIQQRFSVRQTEQLVRRYLSGKRKEKRKTAPKDADLRQLEEELSQQLAAPVSLEQRGQGGRVIIEYNSLDELEGILERLRK